MRQERRLHHRYPVIWELRGRVLRATEPTGEVSLPGSQDVHGAVSNLSAGGVCVLTDDQPEELSAVRGEVEVSGAVRCEILVPDIPIGIPTLLQVRWARKTGDGDRYELGLQFLV
jgi:PilZ domain